MVGEVYGLSRDVSSIPRYLISILDSRTAAMVGKCMGCPGMSLVSRDQRTTAMVGEVYGLSRDVPSNWGYLVFRDPRTAAMEGEVYRLS